MVDERLGERRLRRLASLVIATSVAGVIGTSVFAVWPGLREAVGLEASAAGYHPGEAVDLPLAGARRTFVVFGRSSCSACQRARPFLRRLARMAAGTPGTRVLFVSTDPHGREADEIQYTHDLGLDDEARVRMDVRQLRVRIVPTVVLLDARGVVVRAWGGLPGDAEQAEMLAGVGSPVARE